MPLLNTLLLSDGRPGHTQLAQGIVIAVNRHATVNIDRLDCRRGPWAGWMLAAASNTARFDRLMLERVYGLKPPVRGQYDLIVSAGAETLAANVAFARLSGAANIFYGSLRAFRPESFALVLTSYARNGEKPRHAMVMKPTPLPWHENRAALAGPPATAALLLGGDAGLTRFADQDWQALAGFIAASHQQHGTRWIVSNSRRTPPQVSDRLHQAFQLPHTFIDVRNPGAMPLAQAFEQADAVVCTDDSSSMISEAIGMGLPTIGAKPQRHALTLDEAGYRAYLIDSGWHRKIDIAALTPDRFLAELSLIKPLQDNPLNGLGDLIRQRLPGLYTGPRVIH
jgi:uncharacterized protein